MVCSVLFFSRLRFKGWPHHGRTFSIYFCPMSLYTPLKILKESFNLQNLDLNGETLQKQQR